MFVTVLAFFLSGSFTLSSVSLCLLRGFEGWGWVPVREAHKIVLSRLGSVREAHKIVLSRLGSVRKAHKIVLSASRFGKLLTVNSAL